jgi:hypothetical protein
LKRLQQNLWNVPVLLTLLVISVSLTFAGCSSNAIAPVTEKNSEDQLGTFDGPFIDGGANRGPVTRFTETTVGTLGDEVLAVSQLIGPKGGVIVLSPKGSSPITFRIPAGALLEDKLITVRSFTERTPSGVLAVYDCGPDGTVFLLPIEVVQPVTGKSAASMYYFNPQSLKWELQETSAVKSGAALFHIYHFSKYGIS